MRLRELGEVLISGITIGIVYYLVAVGFTLVYGVGRVLNYSYGSLCTWGAYLAWVLISWQMHLSYPAALLIVLPAMYLAGVLIDRGVVRPLRRRPEFDFSVLLATLGLALFLDNLAQVVFGPRTKSLPPIANGSVVIGGFTISKESGVMFIAASLIAAGLGLFLAKSRLGMSMRAVAQDPIGARIVGIPLMRVYSVTFGISAVLAGLSGILVSSRFFISPLGGWTFLIKALIIVVAGGLGSLRGTLYAAFILGLLEAIVGWQAGLLWVMPFWFLALFVILLVRPYGLFGAVGRQN